MANSFASTSSVNGAVSILKNWYQGPIVSQFNDELPAYREIEKGKEKFSGLQVIRPVKTRRNPGIGATSDGGLLPAIGQQTTQQAQISAKFNYLRFGVTGPMLKASQGDKGAFVSAMSFEMEQGLTDLKNDVNRQIFWDGSGVLANVGAAAVASNTVSVIGREATEVALKYLDVGMVVDFVNSAGVVTTSGLTITGVTGSPSALSASITLNGVVTAAVGDDIIRTGSLNQEIQGFLTAQDGGTSTIFNISRSTYPIFQGNLIDAQASPLSLNLMQQTFNEARRRGGGKTDVVFCDYDSERYYNKLLVADKRFMGTVAGDGTFSSKEGSYLVWAGTKVVPDKDSPQRFFFLDSKTYRKYVLAELEWSDDTGAYLIAQSSADAFEARLRLFANIFCEKPSANSVLKNYLSP